MDERQMELSVGQSLLVGDMLLTIVDIEGDEIHFRLDEPEINPESASQRELVLALPR